jgi:RNA polymerase sigma-70 factor (sigma-E family)
MAASGTSVMAPGDCVPGSDNLPGGSFVLGYRMAGAAGVRREGAGRVGSRPLVAELEAFLAERGGPLLRAAVMLAASREAGEDLLQEALVRLLRHWDSLDGDPEGYLRRTMYHLAADGWRRDRAWRIRQRLLLAAGRGTAAADAMAGVDLRDALLQLLGQLPPRQRTVLVLRYFEQLSEAEAALLLGCSVGSVKSAASRGLGRLRELAADWPESERELLEGELR